MNLLKSSILTTALLAASLSYAQEPITFTRYFSDNTLRLDYIFSGNHDEQHIAVGSHNWSFGANLRTGETGWDQLDIEGIQGAAGYHCDSRYG